MVGKIQLRVAAVACLGLWCGILCARGQSWQPTTAPNSEWEAIASSADGTKLIAASIGLYSSYPGLVYTSSDSGQTWVSNNLPAYQWEKVACSADGSVMMAGPRFSSVLPVYISTNSGSNWNPTSFTGPGTSFLVCSADGTRLTAGFFSRTNFYLSTNSGVSWITNHLTGYWASLAASADATKLVASTQSSSGVFTSFDSGATWTPHGGLMPFSDSFAVGASADGRVLLAGAQGNGGPVFMSTDAGASWASNNIPRQVWDSVASSADGSILAAAGFSKLYVSTNSGHDWSAQTLPSGEWTGITMSADGSKMAATFIGSGSGGIGYGQIWTWQGTPALNLNLAPLAGSNLIFSWSFPTTNFVLQQSDSLTGSGWSSLTNQPALNLSNLQYQLTLPVPNSNAFYRLAVP